jgi:hypothetical protein
MSGGSFQYAYMKFADVASQLQKDRNPLRKALGKHIELIADAMHDIEWVDSGDYSAGKDLEAIKACLTPEFVLSTLIDDAIIMRDNINKILEEIDHANIKLPRAAEHRIDNSDL